MFEIGKRYSFYFDASDSLNHEEAELLEIDDNFFKVMLCRRNIHGSFEPVCVKFYNKRSVDIVIPLDGKA